MTLDDFRHTRWDLAEAIELAQRASGQQPVGPLDPDDDVGVSHLSLKEIRRRASFALAAGLAMLRPRPLWDVGSSSRVLAAAKSSWRTVHARSFVPTPVRMRRRCSVSGLDRRSASESVTTSMTKRPHTARTE